jgi:hypothetical protein
MTTPNTNYLVLDPYEVTVTYNDLSELFLPLGTTLPAKTTGFKYLAANGTPTDINTLFLQHSPGLYKLPYKTNMISQSTRTDLSDVFACNPFEYFVVNDGLYTSSYDAVNNYYTLAFANYVSKDPLVIGNGSSTATLTLRNVKGVTFTVVAGGGGGGGADGYNSGGGGAGGDWSKVIITDTVKTTVYKITVGGGGTGGTKGDDQLGVTPTAGGQGGTSSVSLSNDVTLLSKTGGFGGTVRAGGGSASIPGGVGVGNGKSGGFGGVGGGSPPTNGVSQTNTIAGYTGGKGCYYGGGGAGGSVENSGGVLEYSGGLGGGGGNPANSGETYIGVNSITYPPSRQRDAFPATGGGGAGGNAQSDRPTVVPPTSGGQGASGIVICCFQLAS